MAGSAVAVLPAMAWNVFAVTVQLAQLSPSTAAAALDVKVQLLTVPLLALGWMAMAWLTLLRKDSCEMFT